MPPQLPIRDIQELAKMYGRSSQLTWHTWFELASADEQQSELLWANGRHKKKAEVASGNLKHLENLLGRPLSVHEQACLQHEIND